MIRRYLFKSIFQGFKSEIVLAHELMELLDQSRSNIYKKIKGTVPFSAEKLLKIAGHFGVSLDQFVQNDHFGYEKIIFDYTLQQPPTVNNPELFLEKIRQDLENIISLPQPKMVYATTGLPIFHSLECPNLFAFKLFVWCRINWQLPDMEEAVFDAGAFYEQWPSLEKNRKAIIDLYHRIDSKEFWPKSLVVNEVNQIQYYRDSNFFQDETMPDLIKAELREMFESRYQMSAIGQKKAVDTESRAASFDLYLNELAFTNNLILIYSNERPVVVYATMDNPNFIRSSHPLFCHQMHQWACQIEKCSFHIGNDHYRQVLFRTLFQHIKSI